MINPGWGGRMIQCRLRELMARKERLEQRRITYAVITAETRIAPSTLSRMANNLPEMVDLGVVDRLCAFFSCTPGELLVHVQETETERGGADGEPTFAHSSS
jgi:putative transcriptional regulator